MDSDIMDSPSVLPKERCLTGFPIVDKVRDSVPGSFQGDGRRFCDEKMGTVLRCSAYVRFL